MNKLTQSEKDILKVLKNEIEKSTNTEDFKESRLNLEESISRSEALLRSINIEIETIEDSKDSNRSNLNGVGSIKIRFFEDLLKEAEGSIDNDIDFSDIFTEREIAENFEVINRLNKDFNELHKLDNTDWAICVVMGLVAAAIDIILVGIPEKSSSGIEAGTMSNWIRAKFDEVIPEKEVRRLERISKVSYDHSMNVDNKGNPITQIYVDGLTPYFHRLVSLGHDPFLGLIVGVLDVLSGSMTTIDRKGKIVRQIIPKYEDRIEEEIPKALIKVLNHFKSDINTSMGLPAPLMGLFNLLQFGEVGEFDQTVAEIIQGMYYDGFDFIHFLSSSIPVIIIELGVRMSYSIKRVKEGYPVRDSIPLTTNRNNRPKLRTMLFVSHSIATAVNAGKVTVALNTGVSNPFLAINYPQWLALIKVSLQQLKWTLVEKPELRHKYVLKTIEEEKELLYKNIDNLWREMEESFIFE